MNHIITFNEKIFMHLQYYTYKSVSSIIHLNMTLNSFKKQVNQYFLALALLCTYIIILFIVILKNIKYIIFSIMTF